MPPQIVGTPAAAVKRSESIRSSSVSGRRPRSGKTSEAPVIAAQKGSPQALAWNMGTTIRMRSSSQMPSESAAQAASVRSTVERWLHTTPLGRPVVPDV